MKKIYILFISIFFLNINLLASTSPDEELQNADYLPGLQIKSQPKYLMSHA